MTDFVPFLISWNTTKRCNLRCGHCYLDASELEGAAGELSTEEGMHLIDEISTLSPGAMLILTGGEPLSRGDIFDLASYATAKGLSVVLGTNGTLVTEDMVLKIKGAGIKGVGLSIDSLNPAAHDAFRGLNGAWERTVNGAELLRRNGIEFQFQLSVTKDNCNEIESIVDFAYEKGARAMNVFFLVCTGRGQEMTDIPPEQYEKALIKLSDLDRKYSGKMMVRGRCAPHFLRVVKQRDPESPIMKGATSGCIAGTYYFRITPEGDITPCPYMPTAAGNIRMHALAEIWEKSQIFQRLREPSYGGKCADCEFSDVCGGCRARALAATGDVMGEDPWCEHKPDPKEKGRAGEKKYNIVWTEEASQRLDKVPFFLRGMVRKGLEGYAKAKGLSEITPEMMEEMRKRVPSSGKV